MRELGTFYPRSPLNNPFGASKGCHRSYLTLPQSSASKKPCKLTSGGAKVPSWLHVWVMKYAAPKTKTYLGEYTGRYLAYKKQSTPA